MLRRASYRLPELGEQSAGSSGEEGPAEREALGWDPPQPGSQARREGELA